MPAVPATKKEQILTLARQDPFLKVEEIATRVETTPRYVRTTLSEAKISLMQLRRNYARRMERRLGVDVTAYAGEPGLPSAHANPDKQLGTDEIRVHKVRRAEWARLLEVGVDEHLLKISRVRVLDGVPVFVNHLVTTGELNLSEEMLRGDLPLGELLSLTLPGLTQFRERSLEVEQADPYIAAILGVLPGEPVLRSGNLIVTKGVPVGLEFNIFPAYAVRFVLVGDGDYELKVVGKTG